MGCGESKAAPGLAPGTGEEKRAGVPVRVEVPVDAGWKACTVGKSLGRVDGAFMMRVDNGGGNVSVVLKRPESLNSFASFEDYMSEGGGGGDANEDEDPYEVFRKMLPLIAGQPIDMILLPDLGNKVEGRISRIHRYDGGERVLLLQEDQLVDATVDGPPINEGSMHELSIEPVAGGKVKKVKADLNCFNHCNQLFPSAKAYEEARVSYLKDLLEKFSYVQDAITGKRLNIDDELVMITIDAEEGHGSWSSIASMEGLTEHLLAPSPLRWQGTHDAKGVLLRANAGTGKTVSLQQLTRLLAKQLLADASSSSTAASQKPSKPSSVGPNTGSGNAVGLVPMFVSVQRLASYLKQQVGKFNDKTDLLRAYIDAEYTGEQRDLLAQAYELRALVCAVDGVDEAAGLKSRIETLVTAQLAPMGVRTVVSSRPEGVRPERYKSWVVMNLSPLSDEQQHSAISSQLADSGYFEHLAKLTKLRREKADLATAGGSEYETIVKHIKGSCPAGTDVEEMLSKVLRLFEEASRVPVMLSMLVLCLEMLTDTLPLPITRLDLYKNAVRSSIKKKAADEAEAEAISKMLAKVAVANHIAQRREFTSTDVSAALSDAAELALWKKLDSVSEGLPLVKTLEVGEHEGDSEATSKYQFTHLSFQESYFADALCSKSASVASLWERGALKLLNDRWLLNTFNICGAALGPIAGEHLGNSLSELKMTEHQIKAMVALQWEPLRGRSSLSKITCCCGEGGELSSKSSPGPARLGALLAEKGELGALACIDFGVPAKVGLEAAVGLATASAERRGLRLYGKLSPAQFGSLSDADAVLIAATLRNCAGEAMDVAGANVSSGADGHRLNLKGKSLAEALTASGVKVESLPKDLGTLLMLAGYSASELRTALRYTTAELADIGFRAVDIAASLGPTSPAILKELADVGLAMELVATSEGKISIEELAKAGCSGVPTAGAIERVMDKMGVSQAKCATLAILNSQTSGKDIPDAEGMALVWAVAINCSSALHEIGLDRNKLGASTAAALSQYLRFCTGLKMLDLAANFFGDAEAAVLAKGLACNQTLETLRLSNNKISMAGATSLFEGVTCNYSLRNLTLESGGGTLEEGVQIWPLKALIAAENIDLGSRHFGPLSAAVVCKLLEKYRPPVSTLALEKNPILAEGAVVVAEMIKSNDDVKVLDVKFCGLGPEGLHSLTEALKINSSVERFHALQNNVGQDGAKSLLSLLNHISTLTTSSLKYIDVQDNLFSSESKDEMKTLAAKMGIRFIV